MAPRKQLVEYHSEDEELVQSEVDEGEDDDAGSLADFINDEALEDDDGAESETLESEEDGTPPGRKRTKPAYRQESDDDSVPKSANFSVDDPASPKKKTGTTASKGRNAIHSVEGDDDDDDDDIPMMKVERARPAKRDRAIVVSDDDDSDSKPVPPTPKKSASKAPIVISDDDEPVVTRKKSSSKAKADTIYDSDIVEIPTTTKGTSQRGSAPTKSPKKKVAVKSKAFVEETDDESEVPEPATPRKKVDTKPPTKSSNKKISATSVESDDIDSPVVPRKQIVSKSPATVKTSNATPQDQRDRSASKASGKSPVKTAKNPTLAANDTKHKNAPVKASAKPVSKSVLSDNASIVEDSEDDAVVASKLVDGDTMYRERRTPKAQPANLKRSLPVTPPYNTRATVTVNDQLSPIRKKKKTDNDDESNPQSKKSDVKVKLEEDTTDSALVAGHSDDDDDHPQAVKTVQSTPKTSKRAQAVVEVPSTPKVEKKPRSGDQAAIQRFLQDDEDVFETGPSGSGSKGRRIVFNQKYLDQLWSALAPPHDCEVTDENLLDDYFVSVGGYDGLTPLRFCELKNTGALYTGIPSGTFRFGACKEFLSEVQFNAVSNLIQFSIDGRVVNLSRVDPGAIGARKMNDTRHEIVVKNKTALCFSVGLVRESAVDISSDFGGPLVTRGVRLVFLTYEYERFTAVIGEIARRRSLMTQVWNYGVTIGTKSVKREEDDSAPVAKGNTNNLPASFFNTYVSPTKASRKSAPMSIQTPNSIGHLEPTDDIPVFDARKLRSDFEWNADVFENPVDYFKRFPLSQYDGEIPENALCAPVYITQVYSWYGDRDASSRKAKAKAAAEPQDLRFSLFIRYVLVLATL